MYRGQTKRTSEKSTIIVVVVVVIGLNYVYTTKKKKINRVIFYAHSFGKWLYVIISSVTKQSNKLYDNIEDSYSISQTN